MTACVVVVVAAGAGAVAFVSSCACEALMICSSLKFLVAVWGVAACVVLEVAVVLALAY